MIRNGYKIEAYANLSYANLRGVNLSDADLRDVNLSDADLRDADLWSADLRNADLWGADLRNADLWGADLRNANLRNANLRNANLRNADLWGADLWGADLWGANLRYANLRGADLDFSVWPLWCGTSDVKLDRRLEIQLLAHTIAACPNLPWTNEQIELASRFHRVEEFEAPLSSHRRYVNALIGE